HFRGEKGPGNRRRAEEARRTGQARREPSPAATQWRGSDRRAKVAAGDVAARGSAASATDGATARATGPAERPERFGNGAIQRTGGTTRRAIGQFPAVRATVRRQPA